MLMSALELGQGGLYGQSVMLPVDMGRSPDLGVVKTAQIVLERHRKVVAAHLNLAQRGLIGRRGQSATLHVALQQWNGTEFVNMVLTVQEM